jgi:hypothetical protein
VPFSVTVVAIDSSTGLISTLVINTLVNLYSSSLVSSTPCNLLTIAGCTIASLSVPSAGSYYFTVTDTSNNQLSITPSFSVSASLNTISLSTTNPSPSANFDFFVSVALYDTCGNYFTGITLVTFTGTLQLLGTLSKSISGGAANVDLYCTSTGTNVITATSGSISGQISLNIMQDLIVITAVTPSVRYM